MDFVIVANAWGAGTDNPTSKHRIALELARRGHRVLWVEGAGMRAPSVGSGSDRLRMVRKVMAALRGARKVGGGRWEVAGGGIWILSPLFIPMPKHETVRQLNGVIGAWSARLWCALLGFKDPVLINYVPVLAEIMRRWGRRKGSRCEVVGGRGIPNNQQPIPRNAGQALVPLKAGTNAHVGEQRSTSSHLPPNTSHLSPVSVVYHCVDRWDAFAMYDSAVMAEMDRRCCVFADCVIASAEELRQRCLRWNPNTTLVTHGVDHAHFAQAVGGRERLEGGGGRGQVGVGRWEGNTQQPSTMNHEPSTISPPPSDLPPEPIIGFFGLLSEWVDQALLLRMARAFPQTQLVLIGKADVDVSALKGIPNVHVLGPRPFADLPAYLAHFTVGIIPFVVNDLTRAVNPIKLREMLSGGCPVVSTALPEVVACVEQARIGESVAVAQTGDEFEAGVRRFLEAPLDLAARRALSERMRQETWEAKVDEILVHIGDRM